MGYIFGCEKPGNDMGNPKDITYGIPGQRICQTKAQTI